MAQYLADLSFLTVFPVHVELHAATLSIENIQYIYIIDELICQ
jgi:hypothetical protein